MGWNRRAWLTLAALSGLISVAVGALAAHGVADSVARDWLKTGAIYEMTHALAVFACALVMDLGGRRARLAPPFFLAGAVMFSGSLYALALGAPQLVAAATPIGGCR